VVDPKNNIPIMRNILMHVRDDHVCFTGSDLFRWVTARASARIKERGAELLDATRAANLFPRLDGEAPISFRRKEFDLIVQQGRSRNLFKGQLVASFATPPPITDPVVIPALGDAGRRRLFAPASIVKKDGGVSLKYADGRLASEAVNGNQYIRASIAAAVDLSLPGAVIPKDAAEFIAGMRGAIRISSHLIEAADTNCTYTSKLLDTKIESRERTIPPPSENGVELDAFELVDALKRLDAITGLTQAPFAQIWWEGGNELHLSTSQAAGTATVSVPAAARALR
jgi:DNA polymerase III sliding clamp (beta) subunit (PCNA family)